MDGVRNSTVPPSSGHPFGNTKGGEGLSGATGHDQLASVVVLEAGDRILEGLALVIVQILGLPSRIRSDGLIEVESGPVDGRILENIGVPPGHRFAEVGDLAFSALLGPQLSDVETKIPFANSLVP